MYIGVTIICLNQIKHDKWMKNSNTYPVRSKEPWVGGSEGSPVPSGTSGERCPGVGSWCPWPSGWWTDPYTLGLCLFSPWPWWGAPNPTSGTLWSHPPPSDMSFSSSSSSSSGSLARTSHRAARSSPWSSTANLSTTISVCSSNRTGATTNTREQDVVKPLLSGALWKLSAPHLKNDPLPPFSCQSTPLRSLCPPPLSFPLPHLNSFKDLQQSSEMPPPTHIQLTPRGKAVEPGTMTPVSSQALHARRCWTHTLDCMSEEAVHFSWLVTRSFTLLSPHAALVSTRH